MPEVDPMLKLSNYKATTLFFRAQKPNCSRRFLEIDLELLHTEVFREPLSTR